MTYRIISFSVIFFLIFSITVLSIETDAQVVLVTNRSTATNPFTTRELRKLFLGIPVSQDGKVITPLVNRSNQQLFQLFLQKVLHISESNYDRQLISRVFRLGGQTPKSFKSENKLLDALNQESARVTYLSLTTAKQLSDIKIVQTLW